ncbi:hypothetical protein Leryth_022658 [Lithospermum erythrorhizon]|nr:hypothetical protein Leryth_022658 [Lithospermum erythrorhizon]
MSKLDPSTGRNAKQSNFEELHLIVDDDDLLITITSLWNIALSQPNDPEFATPSVFNCLANLVERCINDKSWLSKGKNIYIPYFAAHIIGSYTMNKAQHAEFAVESGVLSPLMELLRGKISWVEQRVAVRALGHLCSHKKSFQAIKYHENEIITLAMKIASTVFMFTI